MSWRRCYILRHLVMLTVTPDRHQTWLCDIAEVPPHNLIVVWGTRQGHVTLVDKSVHNLQSGPAWAPECVFWYYFCLSYQVWPCYFVEYHYQFTNSCLVLLDPMLTSLAHYIGLDTNPPYQVVYFEGFRPEWCISTIISCLRYTILVGNPRFASVTRQESVTFAPTLQGNLSVSSLRNWAMLWDSGWTISCTSPCLLLAWGIRQGQMTLQRPVHSLQSWPV